MYDISNSTNSTEKFLFYNSVCLYIPKNINECMILCWHIWMWICIV